MEWNNWHKSWLLSKTTNSVPACSSLWNGSDIYSNVTIGLDNAPFTAANAIKLSVLRTNSLSLTPICSLLSQPIFGSSHDASKQLCDDPNNGCERRLQSNDWDLTKLFHTCHTVFNWFAKLQVVYVHQISIKSTCRWISAASLLWIRITVCTFWVKKKTNKQKTKNELVIAVKFC